MAELSTIARPYAKAIFELHAEDGSLADGEATINALAAVVQQPDMAALISHPKVSQEQLVDVISAALGGKLGAQGQNLLKLLVANKRLAAVPAIAEQYSLLKAQAEARIDVHVTAAKPVTDAARDALAEALGKRLGRTVDIDVSTDESLIGGAVVRAGDLVIDGSVKGRLSRVSQALSS